MKGNGWFKAFIGVLVSLILVILAFAYSQGVRDAERDARIADHEKRISKNEKVDVKVDSILFLLAVQHEIKKQENPAETETAIEVIRNNHTEKDSVPSDTNEYRTDSLPPR